MGFCSIIYEGAEQSAFKRRMKLMIAMNLKKRFGPHLDLYMYIYISWLFVLGSTVSIPCRVRNRQGECLWIHDGRGVGTISGKYEFRRTPDNGMLLLALQARCKTG